MRQIGWLTSLVAISAASSMVAQEPRNLIVFLADGAGGGHWTVARHAIGDLAVDRFSALGLSDTRGADHLVTESAAGATALATGVRSYSSALGVGPDSLPRESVLEAAQALGKATGLVTTTYIVDASPAAFFSHARSRNDWGTILGDLVRQRPTVMLGGGRIFFEQIMTADSVPMIDALRSVYTVVDTGLALARLELDTVSRLLGLLAERELPVAPHRSPSLAQLTETALAVLGRDPDGFFLFVENEETDTQAHLNADYQTIADEMRAFDEAIRVAVDYQARHPATLIVVVADHETGGMSVVADSLGTPELRYVTTGHTAELVPVFASGPGADRFAGLIRNDEIGRALLEWMRGR